MKTLKFFALAGNVLAALILTSCSKENDNASPMASLPSHNSNTISAEDIESLKDFAYMQKLQKEIYFYMFEKTNEQLFDGLYQTDANIYNELSYKIDVYSQKNSKGSESGFTAYDPDTQLAFDDFVTTSEIGMNQAMDYIINMEESMIVEIEYQMDRVDNNSILSLYSDILLESTKQLDALNVVVKNNDYDFRTVTLPIDPVKEI